MLVVSFARATGLPAVVGNLLVTDLLHLICDEVRQLCLAGSSLPLVLSVAPPLATASTVSASQQGPFVSGKSPAGAPTKGTCRHI